MLLVEAVIECYNRKSFLGFKYLKLVRVTKAGRYSPNFVKYLVQEYDVVKMVLQRGNSDE